MKKLNKKINFNKETIEAYSMCNCYCYNSCWCQCSWDNYSYDAVPYESSQYNMDSGMNYM